EGLTNNINSLVYEFLIDRDKKLGLRPNLAESWQRINDTTWRFKLRSGVKFHDGTPFTADDVGSSCGRARADTSQLRVYATRSGIPKKIDDLTVEFTTPAPNPTELEDWATINIMSKAWCEKNRATKPQNYGAKEDMITARQANGTGPYVLKSREPDVKTVLVKNPNWWGIKAGIWDGNVDEVVFTPINSDATRLAALISGEIDVINDPPPQDVPRLKQTPNIKVIDKTTMRGLSKPSGALLPAPAQSSPDIEARLPYDKEKAKKLLADAGYPNGFEVTLDCPNNRYVNDEKICQALAAMWSQIGVATNVTAMPRANYFPKLEKLDTSLYMLGWGGASIDPIFILQPVLHTANSKGDGDYNYGRYSNPKFDALVDQVKTEIDVEKRRKLINEALQLQHDELLHLPLHRQVIPWATRSNIAAVHRADNWVLPYWVKLDSGAP